MEVIDVWSGRRAAALRQALRLTNEGFAERLGTAIRTVAKWNAEPDVVPVVDMQRALDTVLYQAPDDVKARFALLLTAEEAAVGPPAPPVPVRRLPEVPIWEEAEVRLAGDRNIGAALEWLDRWAGWAPGTGRREVAGRLAILDKRELQDRGCRRGQVGRHEIAAALSTYYGSGIGGYRPYRARCGDEPIATSILTRPAWLDLALPLGAGNDDMTFTGTNTRFDAAMDDAAADAAAQRIAEALATNMRLVNAPIYRLLDIDVAPGRIEGTAGLTDFASYALTMDLLENELVDAVTAGRDTHRGTLPLRDRYLPDVAAVVDLDRRLCAGGPLGLCAIARPASRSRRGAADYLFLVQERSGRVLNSARRLAVIPKAFHGPLVDYGDDVQLSATLERELEEELFGRNDVDSTIGDRRHADPMHPSRLSKPMRWLNDHGDGEHWRMECTGFGYNLVSGNFEFASLVVVEDEEWWGRFGGRIEANWESDGLRRYSSQSPHLLAELARDSAWSNEGLFALLQGFRRLAETGGSRVNLPAIETEI